MNSQKLSRLIQPGMALYFCLLFASRRDLLLRRFLPGAGGGSGRLLLLLYFKINAMRRRREISAYIQTATDTLETAAKGEMPFPMALVKLGTGEIVWSQRPLPHGYRRKIRQPVHQAASRITARP